MKRILQFALTLCLTTTTSLVFAETFTFKSEFAGGSSSNYHPGLDLNSIGSIEITAETNIHQPHANISRLKLNYANATDLIASNFSYDGNTYRAVVNGAWIYKKVIVELQANDILSNPAPYVDVRIIVPDFTSNTNDPNMTAGVDIANAFAHLTNTTTNPLADIENIIADDKKLTLRLLERPTMDVPTGKQGFKIEARWLGNGNRNIFVATPFPPQEFTRYKAIGIDIQTLEHPDGQTDHMFQIRYEDMHSGVMITPLEPLRPHLDQVYPPMP